MGLLVLIILSDACISLLAFVDCVLREREKIQVLSRSLWLVTVLLVPFVGALLWLTIGRGWGKVFSKPERGEGSA
ncbi:PLD nuclease N-terminal domain-containing protein [Tropheryma whipplei]|uniref:PLD nuclease N-terminal domain-containing protein n=1 Tax=Tropheryma whipplei TaxID=2039 RepID=UPI00057034CB|nr:PLD nuclease N-terminal domain-containing protein [Tropheryma whipplei]